MQRKEVFSKCSKHFPLFFKKYVGTIVEKSPFCKKNKFSYFQRAVFQ
jgi:hypothetical protein